MKKVIAPAVSFLMLALLPAAAFSLDVKYEVWVQTGSAKGADTSAAITIMLTNEAGTSSPVLALKNSSTNRVPFQAGKLDKFTLQIGTDLGPIKTVTLKSDNAGKGPEWWLEGLKVYYSPPSGKPDPRYPVEGRLNVTNFRYGDWISKDKKLVVSLNTTDRIAGAAAPQAAPLPPPSRLTATAQSTTAIGLSWVYATRDDGGFKIERSETANGGFAEIGTMPAGKPGFASSGLAPNKTYYFRVRAYHDNAHSAYSNTVSAMTLNLDAPGGLTLSEITALKAKISWTYDSSRASGFEIERSLDNNANFVLVQTVDSNVKDRFIVLTQNKIFFVRVRAYNSAGKSAYSNVVSATTPAVDKPINLNMDSIGTTYLKLKWTILSQTANQYQIERSISSSSGFALIETTSIEGYSSYPNRMWNIRSLTPNTTYYFRIRGKNGNNYSEYSATVSATTLATAPGAPYGLTASETRSSSIKLTWQDNSSNETGFKIEKSTAADSGFVEIATANANSREYNVNTDLVPGTSYYFRIRAILPNGYSDYSNTVAPQTYPVSIPQNVTATVLSATSIKISCRTGLPGPELWIQVEQSRSADGGFAEIGTSSVVNYLADYVVNGLQPGTRYYFRLRAKNPAGYFSTYSSTVSATTQGDVAAPANLTAAAQSNSSIKIDWVDNSNNEVGFKIERSTAADGGFTEIGSVNANIKTFTSTGLARNTNFYFRVRAYTTAFNSGYSNTASAKTPLQ